MIQPVVTDLTDLYEADETAWLETMAELIHQRRWSDLDYPHLQEYLSDMARRDRREVASRLTVLIAHLLKWTYQPDQRSRSRRGTIVEQRQELASLLDSGVLRNHAEAILTEVYQKAIERAVAETGLATEAFPGECPYTLDLLLTADYLSKNAPQD
jgi:uncharacterized protein DUF29